MKHKYWKGLIVALGLTLAGGCHVVSQAESGQNSGRVDASAGASETVAETGRDSADVLVKNGEETGDSAADAARDEAVAAPEGGEGTDGGDVAAQPEDWAYDLMGKADAVQLAIYDAAQAIIKDETGYTGKMKSESRHFGDWYQIIYEPELLMDDVGQVVGFMKDRSFLVNMAEKHVIPPGDFRRAKPFFDALVDVFSRKPASVQGRFVGELASAVSTVAFGHSSYEIGSPDADVPPSAPHVSQRPDKFVLEYDVSVGRGENLRYDRCRLTLLGKGISFSADQAE